MRAGEQAPHGGPEEHTQANKTGKNKVKEDCNVRPQKKMNALNSAFIFSRARGSQKGEGKAHIMRPLKSKVSDLHLALVDTGVCRGVWTQEHRGITGLSRSGPTLMFPIIVKRKLRDRNQTHCSVFPLFPDQQALPWPQGGS